MCVVALAESIARRGGVPLSEEEQRILSEIEEHLYQEDPRLAREVERSNVYAYSGRHLKWAIAGMVIGILLIPVFLAMRSVTLAVTIGFGVAFASGIWAYLAFRRVTQAGINDLRRKRRTLMEGDTSPEKFRRRFRRDEDF